MNIKGKNITVIGLGESGFSAAKLARYKGAHVFVSEQSNNNKNIEYLNVFNRLGIEYEIGEHSSKVYHSDMWIVSPGIPKNSKLIKVAINAKIEIFGEIEFASWYTESFIIAITGSNGKTTTSNIINSILIKSNYVSYLAGNIGIPFSKVVLEEIENNRKDIIYVLEISSFQMEFINLFRPNVGIYLNISPDHLDRHLTMSEYINLKTSMVSNQLKDDFIVYNYDDEILKKYFQKNIRKTIPFSTKKDSFIYSLKNNKILNQKKDLLINCGDIGILGQHNFSNIMASLSAIDFLNIDNQILINALKELKPIEHRLELIKTKENINFINDSKATNIEAVMAAIKAFKNPIILLLGGRSKGSNFQHLLPSLSKNIKFVIVFGESANDIATQIRDAVRLEISSSLEDAVVLAHKLASFGDIVLLSPGCASFDEFSDYKERGIKFKSIIKRFQ